MRPSWTRVSHCWWRYLRAAWRATTGQEELNSKQLPHCAGIKPKTLFRLDRLSATELHPQPPAVVLLGIRGPAVLDSTQGNANLRVPTLPGAGGESESEKRGRSPEDTEGSGQSQAHSEPVTAQQTAELSSPVWAVGVVGDGQRNTCPSSKAGGGGHVGVAGTVARPLLFPLCHLTMATGNTLAGLR